MVQYPLENTAPHSTASEKKKPPLHLTFLIPRVLWVSEPFSLLLHYQPHFVEIFCPCFLVSLDHKLLEGRDSLSSLNPVSPGAQ